MRRRESVEREGGEAEGEREGRKRETEGGRERGKERAKRKRRREKERMGGRKILVDSRREKDRETEGERK